MNIVTFIPPRLDRLDEQRGGLLIMFRFEERQPLVGVEGLIDWRLHGHLSRLIIDGFLSGNTDESLLVPLERRLPHDNLIVFGLGPTAGFCEKHFTGALERMFRSMDKLDASASLTISLPGRSASACSSADAIDWFLPVYDNLGKHRDITIIESTRAQKAMLPAVERWRLKNSVPSD